MLTEELGRHGDSGKAVPAAHSPEKPQAKGWKEAQEVLAPKGPPGLENSLLRGESRAMRAREEISRQTDSQYGRGFPAVRRTPVFLASE